jgi:hypothetical protein
MAAIAIHLMETPEADCNCWPPRYNFILNRPLNLTNFHKYCDYIAGTGGGCGGSKLGFTWADQQ